MSTKLVNLKDGSDYLVPKVFSGIDTTNVIASSISSGYTATQDCWAYFRATHTHSSKQTFAIYINGTEVGVIHGSNNGASTVVPLKAGQVLTYSFSVSESTQYISIFGIKF